MTSTLGIKKIQYPNGTNIATLDSSGSIAFAGASTVAGTLGVTGAITGTLATAAQTNITSVGTLTSFRSTGIDDNADAVALTIDNGENVAIGVTSKNSSNNGSLTIGHTGMTKITGSANGNADELVLIGADASANVGMSIISNNANIGGIFFGDEDDTDIGRIEYYHSDNSMRFQTNTAERMRITSAGNVGIGYASSGTKLHIRSSVASNIAGYRDGTTGLIVEGDAASYIQIIASKTNPMGILFDGGDTHNDTSRGAMLYDIDYGLAFKSGGATRWKIDEAGDIIPYSTSSGIVLGSTSNVAANTLDDYEEGTWTPTVSSGTFSMYGVRWYTKIGNLVTCNCYLYNFSGGTTNSQVVISGLPFTFKSSNEAFFAILHNGGATSQPSGSVSISGRIGQNGGTSFGFACGKQNGSAEIMTYAHLGSGHYVMTFSYITAS